MRVGGVWLLNTWMIGVCLSSCLVDKFHKSHRIKTWVWEPGKAQMFSGQSVSDSHAKSIVERHKNMQAHEAILQVLESNAFLFS